MIYFDEKNEEANGYFCQCLKTRGLEYASFKPGCETQDKKKQNCYLSICETSLEIEGNQNIINFLKQHFFKKAVFIKFGSEKYAINTFLNNSIFEIHVPYEFDLQSTVIEYLVHYVIEIAVGEYRNLPCADAASSNLVDLLRKIAARDVTVLVNGPTGTGKEVVSQLTHEFSSRSEGPFVAVNCAAIPEQMLESTLFGHEKGAFTGAVQQNVGLFRAAGGGTILLDEISEMPLSLQAKLLRVLQEKRVMAVGGSNETPVEDLFYRLNVFPINTLALRDRIKDIIPIAANMVFKLDQQSNTHTLLTREAIHALFQYDWPGNVRELGNVIHRAHILSSGNKITTADLIFDGYVAEGSMNTADALAAKLQNEKA
ncbi:MAG: sigma-54-dependent Fis family transcriptional regulator [Rhodobacteraceae bacterium]|nr:sigma-54-dependent Fis family transcriptional regulator [Paracoccaceae bacterium]